MIVVTNSVTDVINEIVKKLSGEQSQLIAGFRGEQVIVLEPNQIVRIYASNGKVYAEAENGTYLLRLRLYEMEQRLANQSFVRISNSEIINLKKVRGFAMASIIWELDSWNLAKQSGIYFLIACILMLPIAYIANWMEHSVGGFLSYVGTFVAIFVAIWLAQYLSWKQKIKKMNELVNKENGIE